MLASDVITQVRSLINDASGTLWPNAELLGWLAEAQRRVLMLRPDAGLTATTAITLRPATTLAIGDTLTLNEDFKSHLVNWVCYRAFLQNSENTENATRAASHLSLFNSEMY